MNETSEIDIEKMRENINKILETDIEQLSDKQLTGHLQLVFKEIKNVETQITNIDIHRECLPFTENIQTMKKNLIQFKVLLAGLHKKSMEISTQIGLKMTLVALNLTEDSCIIGPGKNDGILKQGIRELIIYGCLETGHIFEGPPGLPTNGEMTLNQFDNRNTSKQKRHF